MHYRREPRQRNLIVEPGGGDLRKEGWSVSQSQPDAPSRMNNLDSFDT
jgi:hypothetical protein